MYVYVCSLECVKPWDMSVLKKEKKKIRGNGN